MAPAVLCRPLRAEERIQPQTNPHGNCGVQNVVYRMTLEQVFLRTLRVSSVRNVPTAAPCSFVHTSLTLYSPVN
jgi:hypothetical protein